jgi:hypothetical protein
MTSEAEEQTGREAEWEAEKMPRRPSFVREFSTMRKLLWILGYFAAGMLA